MNSIQATQATTTQRVAALLLTLGTIAGLSGCAAPGVVRVPNARESVQAELQASRAPVAAPVASPAPPAVQAEAAPPPAAPRPDATPEPRFDLIVSGASARDVFLSMVTDTRYSMLMHPELTGTLSVTLRGVTVREALESIRDVYGYEFKIDGRRITVFPATMQTRIFMANYLQAKRQGRSDTRVSSGAAPSNNNNNNNNSQSGNGNGSNSNGGESLDSSQVSTTSSSDIWAETSEALRSIVGTGNGRNVITSPQSGTIAVRAMPEELRQVENYLRASRLALERQVMLEAKIVEVELREGFQSGIDWSLLRRNRAIGQTSGIASNALVTNNRGLPTLPSAVASLLVDSVSVPAAGSGTLGLAIATNGFQAVLGFLETHGDVQILSSPRVATLNNQKAVLKVGTDEYFVTNVSGGSVYSGNSSNNNGTTTLPALTLTPFFSGIALDVTPQIDDANTITLHVHPSVTAVSEVTKRIDLGTIGSYKLPLASSSVNETDTVVRVTDGNIVAIGGLMQVEAVGHNSGLPGSSSNRVTQTLFGNTNSSSRKKELVVLIKPTIIRNVDDWQQANHQAASTFDETPGTPRRVITVTSQGQVAGTVAPAPVQQPAAAIVAPAPVQQPVAAIAAPAPVQVPVTETVAAVTPQQRGSNDLESRSVSAKVCRVCSKLDAF
jgi:MSHA biogenesis protein MshL